MNKYLESFFITRLDAIPDESFVEANSETNSVGTSLTNYRKMLDRPERNIFNIIEVKAFEGGGKNVFFLNHDLEAVSLIDVQKLINDLYLLFGPDDNGKGAYNSQEKEDYYSEDFYTLFGRSWNDSDKRPNPVNLSIDREAGTISLGIWGIK